MTAGEEIRRAAALMRERAKAATDGLWAYDTTTHQHSVLANPTTVYRVKHGEENVALAGRRADAEHIASWHPAVALAVADWLDDVAEAVADEGAEHTGNMSGPANRPDSLIVSPYEAQHALAVARAYLGEP